MRYTFLGSPNVNLHCSKERLASIVCFGAGTTYNWIVTYHSLHGEIYIVKVVTFC